MSPITFPTIKNHFIALRLGGSRLKNKFQIKIPFITTIIMSANHQFAAISCSSFLARMYIIGTTIKNNGIPSFLSSYLLPPILKTIAFCKKLRPYAVRDFLDMPSPCLANPRSSVSNSFTSPAAYPFSRIRCASSGEPSRLATLYL